MSEQDVVEAPVLPNSDSEAFPLSCKEAESEAFWPSEVGECWDC